MYNQDKQTNKMKHNLTALALFILVLLFAASCKKDDCTAPSIPPLTAPSDTIASIDTMVYYLVEVENNQGGYQTWANGQVMPFDFDTLYSGDSIRVFVIPSGAPVHLVVRINGQIDIDSTCSCDISYTKTLD